MNFFALQAAHNGRNVKMTVLRRIGGTWHPSEVSDLVDGLMTEVGQDPQHPEHLVLLGHYTKKTTLKALGGGQTYTATKIVGTDSEELPFVPGFA